MELTDGEKAEVETWLVGVEERIKTEPNCLVPKEVLNTILKATNWPRPYHFDFTRPQNAEESLKVVAVARERLQSIATVPEKVKVVHIEDWRKKH